MKYIRVILFVIICIGCSPIHSYEDDFKKIRKEFPDSLLLHFPSILNDHYSFKAVYPSALRYNNRCGVLLVAQLDSSSINQFKNEIDSISNKKKSDDKSLLVVNMFGDESSGKLFIEHYKKYFSPPYSVIPHFSKLLKSERSLNFTKEGYLENYDLYILEEYKGDIIENQKLSFGWGLPSEWRNGYSRGVAINEERSIVIYWLEIW